MKNKYLIILSLIMILSAALTSCSKKKEIEFCEGASTAGKGINCGTVFSYGDLTAIVHSRETFNAESISISIQIKDGSKFIPVETVTVNVKPDDNQTITNISLIKKGIYEITALKGDKIYAKENIEIAE